MRKKRRSTHFGGPRMRPPDPDDADRMTAGVLRSMQLAGYDYPIRKLRRVGDVCCVTLSPQVRQSLQLERGDWLVFGSTSWRGVAGFVRVTAEQYEVISPNGRKEFRKLARKVLGRDGSLVIGIPPAIREILSAEAGDSLMFDIVPGRSMIIVAAIKGGGQERANRRPGG